MIREAFRNDRRLTDLPCDHPARRLKQVWDRLSITDDGILVVDGDKIYMPPGARKGTLQELHKSHCRLRQDPGNCEDPLLLANHEGGYQDDDRELRSVPETQAE